MTETSPNPLLPVLELRYDRLTEEWYVKSLEYPGIQHRCKSLAEVERQVRANGEDFAARQRVYLRRATWTPEPWAAHRQNRGHQPAGPDVRRERHRGAAEELAPIEGRP